MLFSLGTGVRRCPALFLTLILMASPTPSVSRHISNYRWLICALLFFATTINYFDRQILSLVKEILDRQLGWTNEDFGRINGAFQGAYGIGLVAFGWFIDRFGTKIGYAVSITAWSLAAIGHGLVTTLSGFFVARISLGLGEGGNFPSAIKATALWFPKRERALATSLFNSGANVGAIIAPLIVPFVAYRYGWHWAFAGAGIAGLIWLCFWIPLYGLPDKKKQVNAAELALIHSDPDEAASRAPMETSKQPSVFASKGRATRATLWGNGLALIGLSIIVAFVVVDLFTVLHEVGRMLNMAVSIVWTAIAFAAVLALQIRRWHDLGKGAAYEAINLVVGLGLAAASVYGLFNYGYVTASEWLKLLVMIPSFIALAGLIVTGFQKGDADANAFGAPSRHPGLLAYRQTWSFIVAKFMTDPIWWFFLIWLPDYFKATRGLDIKKSFLHLSTIYVLITIFSIVGGWITGHLAKRGWSVTRARKTGMFIFACCVVPILAVSYVGDWAAVLLIALAGSAHQAWSANLYTTVSDMFPKRAVASVTGIGGLAGAFMGIYFPIYCGQLLDRFHLHPAHGYAILFSVCAFTYLITFAIHHVLAPRFEQIKM